MEKIAEQDLSREEKQAKGHKASKERFILMPTIDTTGDAVLRPQLMYHSENLRALKGTDKNTLPGLPWWRSG